MLQIEILIFRQKCLIAVEDGLEFHYKLMGCLYARYKAG